MFPKHIRTFLKLPAFLKHLFFQKKQTQVEQIHSKKSTSLNSKKQVELENLCNQLFKKKELITSGKLQFIGLAKIKKRMGKQWEGLSKIVYETTEEIIDKHMGKGDIFIRYKDDTYIIVFAHATPEESQLKASLIAEEIRKRLFELDEEELRDIEIREAVSEIRTDLLMESDFLDGMFDLMDDSFGDLDIEFQEAEQQDNIEPPPEIQATEVDTQNYKPIKTPIKKRNNELPALNCCYVPLWDTSRGALTTYLCLARGKETGSNPFDNHKTLYNSLLQTQTTALDHAMLQVVAAELKAMEEDGRQFFIICPVQHETVYNMEKYEEYKRLLSHIPLGQRKFLLLLVIDINIKETKPPKNAYWFAKPLRVFCPHVFVEIPLRQDINFNYLHNSGVNVVGVRLDNKAMTEQDTIHLLSNFSTKAKSLKISKTFVLDVSSLSLTTSAVCAGFDFLGGSAIHDPVDKPDSVHRYHHADLIAGLGKQD